MSAVSPLELEEVDTSDVQLYQDLHLDDDAKCEADHTVDDSPFGIACSGEVLYRWVSKCDPPPVSLLICATAAQRMVERIARSRETPNQCGGCPRRIQYCWSVVPV